MRLRFVRAARNDIARILSDSELNFGTVARLRYERLLKTALQDIQADPLRVGSVLRSELEKGEIRSWHLRGSRERAAEPEGKVRRPRHLIVYRTGDAEVIVIVRVLHDAMELDRHLSASD